MKVKFLADYSNKKKGMICSLNGAVADELKRLGVVEAYKVAPAGKAPEVARVEVKPVIPVIESEATGEPVKQKRKRK